MTKHEARNTHGWAAPALLATAFVVFYAASSGPAVLALALADYPDGGQTLFGIFYCPFALLPHPAIDWFKSWLDWWTALAP